MRKLLYLLVAIALLSSGNEAFGQMNRRTVKKNNKRISHYKGRKSAFSKEKRYNAAGFSLSALNYYGDLAPRPSRFSTDISFTRPALGLSFTHRFGPFYSITGSFMYGTLKGSDKASANANDVSNGVYRYDRNLSFRNRIKELSVVATFDLFQNQSTYISRVKWTPYAFVGVALFLHNPKAQVPKTDLNGNPFSNAGDWVSLQSLGTEGQYANLDKGDVNYGIKKYHKLQIAIPFGIGARYRLNQVMDISAEIGFRYTFTDYLDDVSKNYVDLDKLDGELARAMSYRTNEVKGTPPPVGSGGVDSGGYTVWPGYGSESKYNMRGSKNDRDIYMVTTFRLTYILGKTFHRAKFR
jgi:hypothetical protein